jgi:hypothetical protein
MKAKVLFLAVFMVIFPFFLARCAWGLDPDWKLVARLAGTVESQKAQQDSWNFIWESRMLKDGDKARTSANSRAKICLADQSVLTIGESSLVEMSEFKMTPQSRTVKLKLEFGKLRSRVEKFLGKDSRFEVTTPNAVLAARGTDFLVDQEKVTRQFGAGGCYVVVFSGTVNIHAPTGNFTLLPGQTGLVTTGGQFFLNPPQITTGGGTPAAGPPAGGGDDLHGGGQGRGVDSDLWRPDTGGTPPGGTTPQYDIVLQGASSGNPSPQGQIIINPNTGNTGSLPIIIK